MKFSFGDKVTWHHERGGYGFVHHTPSRVISAGPSRVRIAGRLEQGGEKEVSVTPAKLTPEGAKCRVCYGRRMETAMEKGDGLSWSEQAGTCADCGRAFRLSREALATVPASEIAFCLRCAAGVDIPGERP